MTDTGMRKLRRLATIGLFVAAYCTGPFADGLPGEYLVTQRWHDLNLFTSPLGNPAFLTEENYLTLRGAFAPTMGAEFKLWDLGLTVPIGLYQSLGVMWLGEDDGLMDSASIDGQGRISPSGSGSGNLNNALYLTYAINPWNRLSVGASAVVAHQTNFGDGAIGYGGDLGITYRALRHPLLGDHLLGAMFQNMLPPKVSTEDDSRYAVNFKGTWLMKLWEGRIESGIDVDVKDFLFQAEEFLDSLDESAIEYDVNYRVGLWFLRLGKIYAQLGSDYWGFSVGMNAPVANNGRDLQVMYQYLGMLRGKGASSHTVYLRANIGMHREEVYARKMARLASISPNLLYNKALKLYHAGKYWEALFVFSEIRSKYPDFFKNDWVEYYRASCFEELDMRARSLEDYDQARQKYPRSVTVPLVNLGMMRIHYRNADHNAVHQQFKLLNRPEVPDSIRYHAFYLLGETQMKTGQMRQAIQTFKRIPEMHPEYVFAQHSLAIAYVHELNLEDAMMALENCLQVRLDTKAQKEIANRSAMLLGYMFYEKSLLSKAVTALRMVPKDSYYFEDAQLGLAWAALRAGQWNDCIDASRKLADASSKPALQAEAWLLSGYGHMMQKNHPAAAEALDRAATSIAQASELTRDSLLVRKREYESDRMDYTFLSAEVNRISMAGQSPHIEDMIDSLHTEQQTIRQDLYGFLVFNDEFNRSGFFARSIDRVQDDVEYAAAVVRKMLNRGEGEKATERMRKEQKTLDKQIEELEKELEEIEE